MTTSEQQQNEQEEAIEQWAALEDEMARTENRLEELQARQQLLDRHLEEILGDEAGTLFEAYTCAKDEASRALALASAKEALRQAA